MSLARSARGGVGLCLVCLVAAAWTAVAQIPAEFNYQVMLTDDADQPLADETVTMVFTIYDSESGGTALWTETHNPTTNSIGVVSVILGSITPVGFDFDMALWLEVEVNGETLSPRRPFTAAPYAGHAAGADDSERLGGVNASEYALLTDLVGTGDGHSLDADDGDPVDALYVDGEGNVGIGTASPQAELHVSEELQVGSPTTSGTFDLYQNGGASPVVELGSLFTSGRLALKSTSGTQIGAFGPSFYGGGYLEVNGANGSVAAAGNDMFSGSPSLSISGSGSSMSFNSGYSGNASVDLPDNAIDADEIEAEPGVASIQSANELDLASGAVLSVAARTITVPDHGYVFVLGTAGMKIVKYGTESHLIDFGVSEYSNAWSSHAQEQRIQLPGSGVDNGVFYFHAAVSGLFEVTPGTHTFYMLAQELQGDCDVLGRQLTLMYFPTDYGLVGTTD